MNTATTPLTNPLRSFRGRSGDPQSRSRPSATGSNRSIPPPARRLLECLDELRFGRLHIELPDGSLHLLGKGSENRAADGVMIVHDWTVFEDVIARGDIGFGEAYIAGAWDSPDLTQLLTLLNRNRDVLAEAIHGRWWSLLIERLRHRKNANTRAGSQRNIMAHYDLGNAFYAEWLDPTMSYSSALFGSEPYDLREAQLAKYRRIITQLGIQPGDHILEIGCGWGGFAEVAASEAGARVTGITLSPAQLAFAQERMRRTGVDDRVRLSLTDYRELAQDSTRYDHVVSIEMFEAVGMQWWPSYFATVGSLLKPGGQAMIQSITIDDALFSHYSKNTDFIQQHVFPGGMLPSPKVFREHAGRAGLEVRDSFAFGEDYARTLATWAQHFNAAWPRIVQHAEGGFDVRFCRLWNFYLAYCQAGFRTGTTDVMQFRLQAAP